MPFLLRGGKFGIEVVGVDLDCSFLCAVHQDEMRGSWQEYCCGIYTNPDSQADEIKYRRVKPPR